MPKYSMFGRPVWVRDKRGNMQQYKSVKSFLDEHGYMAKNHSQIPVMLHHGGGTIVKGRYELSYDKNYNWAFKGRHWVQLEPDSERKYFQKINEISQFLTDTNKLLSKSMIVDYLHTYYPEAKFNIRGRLADGQYCAFNTRSGRYVTGTMDDILKVVKCSKQTLIFKSKKQPCGVGIHGDWVISAGIISRLKMIDLAVYCNLPSKPDDEVISVAIGGIYDHAALPNISFTKASEYGLYPNVKIMTPDNITISGSDIMT